MNMYRRPKFLEVVIEIRQTMAREADYDVDLFSEMLRNGSFPARSDSPSLTDDAAPAKRTAPSPVGIE